MIESLHQFDLTESGVVISGGISVFIFCARADVNARPQTRATAIMISVFILSPNPQLVAQPHFITRLENDL